MSPTEKAEISRRNGQLSEGPTSAEGKRIVSRNALKHGFAGQTIIIPDHELEVYERHFAAFRSEHRPVGPTEEFMVQSLAEYSWAIQQIRSTRVSSTGPTGRNWSTQV